MENKTWYKIISLIAIIVTIISGICVILGISIFDSISLIKNKKDSKISSTIINSFNTKGKTEKNTEEFTYSNNNLSKDNLQSKSSIDIEELTTEKDTYVQVIAETLNIRDEPNSDGTVMAIADKNDKFLVLKTIKIDENIWYEIQTEELVNGYIFSGYVKIITE